MKVNKIVLYVLCAGLFLYSLDAVAGYKKVHVPGKRGSNIAKTAAGWALLGLGLAEAASGGLVLAIGRSSFLECYPEEEQCSEERMRELRNFYFLLGGAAIIMGTGMVITGLVLLATRKYMYVIQPPGHASNRIMPFLGYNPASRSWSGGLRLSF